MLGNNLNIAHYIAVCIPYAIESGGGGTAERPRTEIGKIVDEIWGHLKERYIPSERSQKSKKDFLKIVKNVNFS